MATPFYLHHEDAAATTKEACGPSSPTCLSEQRPETRGTAQRTPLHQARHPISGGEASCLAPVPHRDASSRRDCGPSPPYPTRRSPVFFLPPTTASGDQLSGRVDWAPRALTFNSPWTVVEGPSPPRGQQQHFRNGTKGAGSEEQGPARSLPGEVGSEASTWGSGERCVHLLQAHLLLFTRSVVSSSLQPHGPQHTRLPCP